MELPGKRKTIWLAVALLCALVAVLVRAPSPPAPYAASPWVQGALALQGLRSPTDTGEIRRDLVVTIPIALFQNLAYLTSRLSGDADELPRIAWIRGHQESAGRAVWWIWIAAGAAAAFLAARARPHGWSLLAGLLAAVVPVAVAGTERLAPWALASPLVLFVLTARRRWFAAAAWGAILSLTPLGFLLAGAAAVAGNREDRVRLLFALPIFLALDPSRLADPWGVAASIVPGLTGAGWPGIGDGPRARLLVADWTPGVIPLFLIAVALFTGFRHRLVRIGVFSVALIWVFPALLGAKKAGPVGFVAPLALVLAVFGARQLWTRAIRGRVVMAIASALLLVLPVGRGFYEMTRTGGQEQDRNERFARHLVAEVGPGGLLVFDPAVELTIDSIAAFPFPTHVERPEVWDFAYWPGWFGEITHMAFEARTLQQMERLADARPGARSLLLGLARHARPVAIVGEPETDPTALLLFRLDSGPPWDPKNRHERMQSLRGGEVEARFLGDFAAFLAENDHLERAIALLRVALRWDPDSPKLWHNLGTTLLLLGEEKDAAETLSLGLQRNPTSVELRYALARAYLEGNVPGRAVIELRKVLARRPNYGAAHYDMARAAAELKQWSLAARALESYLQLEPNPPNRADVLAALDEARRLAGGDR